MSASKPCTHAQYRKLILVVVLVFRSKRPYYPPFEQLRPGFDSGQSFFLFSTSNILFLQYSYDMPRHESLKFHHKARKDFVVTFVVSLCFQMFVNTFNPGHKWHVLTHWPVGVRLNRFYFVWGQKIYSSTGVILGRLRCQWVKAAYYWQNRKLPIIVFIPILVGFVKVNFYPVGCKPLGCYTKMGTEITFSTQLWWKFMVQKQCQTCRKKLLLRCNKALRLFKRTSFP